MRLVGTVSNTALPPCNTETAKEEARPSNDVPGSPGVEEAVDGGKETLDPTGKEEVEEVSTKEDDGADDQCTVADSVQESMCSSIDAASTHVAVDGNANRDEKGIDLSKLIPKREKKVDKNPIAVTPAVPVPLSPSSKVKHEKIVWEKPEWTTKVKLKPTAQGDVVKKGADLQKPITQVNANKQTEVFECPSPSIESPGADNPKKEAIKWEKPEWTQSPQLKATERGSVVKKGVNLAAPITKINAEKKDDGSVPVSSPVGGSSTTIKWEKPKWTEKNGLRSTEKGEVVKKGSDLQAPITHVVKDTLDDINFEANPMILKATKQGSAARFGENLAKPITNIQRDPMGDVNFEANPTLLQESETGQALKEGACLASPITFPQKSEGRDANFEANPAMLRSTGKGAVIRQGEEISRPVTFPNGKADDDCSAAPDEPNVVNVEEIGEAGFDGSDSEAEEVVEVLEVSDDE